MGGQKPQGVNTAPSSSQPNRFGQLRNNFAKRVNDQQIARQNLAHSLKDPAAMKAWEQKWTSANM